METLIQTITGFLLWMIMLREVQVTMNLKI